MAADFEFDGVRAHVLAGTRFEQFLDTAREVQVAVLVKEAAKLQKASSEPNRKKVATLNWNQVREIAKEKMPDLNCFTEKSAMKMVAGTARSMGVTITGEFPADVQ